MNNFKLIGAFLLVACISACRISQKSVTGLWISHGDTLVFDSKKQFTLTARQKQFEGTWYVKGRSVYMDFKDEAGKNIFGSCDGLTNRRTSFSRYTLIRPGHCGLARLDFVGYKKLRHLSRN